MNLNKKELFKGIENVMDIVIEIFNFIILYYIFACFLLSFNRNIVFVFLFASSCFYLFKFKDDLKKYISNKILVNVLFYGSIAIVVLLLKIFGYLQIPNFLKEVL